jgi:hypothetical protein
MRNYRWTGAEAFPTLRPCRGADTVRRACSNYAQCEAPGGRRKVRRSRTASNVKLKAWNSRQYLRAVSA